MGKRIELLKGVLPALSRAVIVANPTHPGEPTELRESWTAAQKLFVVVSYHPVRGARKVEAASACCESESRLWVELGQLDRPLSGISHRP